jgi:hypothetical protein
LVGIPLLGDADSDVASLPGRQATREEEETRCVGDRFTVLICGDLEQSDLGGGDDRAGGVANGALDRAGSGLGQQRSERMSSKKDES